MTVFVARGIVASPDTSMVGRHTYVSQAYTGFYQWDGLHKVAVFASKELALAAAAECRGPLFLLPAPETIEAVLEETARLEDGISS